VGAVILAAVMLKYGIARRASSHERLAPGESARRLRNIRLADTLAVLCFAVAAGLGVVGLTQNVRPVPPVVATVDDTAMRERLSAIEGRVSKTEQQLQSRHDGPDLRAYEGRLARLESRLGAVEERAAVAERRATEADRRSAATEQLAERELRTRATSVVSPKKPAASEKSAVTEKTVAPAPSGPVPVPLPAPPGASPRLNPPGREGQRVPEPSRPALPEAPKQQAGGPAATAERTSASDDDAMPAASVATAPAALREPARAPIETTPRQPGRLRTDSPPREPIPLRAEAVVPREPVRQRPEPAPQHPSFGEKLRRDWASVREHVERGGDEWRNGWRQLKSLFGQ
jgi:hypothetical protein